MTEFLNIFEIPELPEFDIISLWIFVEVPPEDRHKYHKLFWESEYCERIWCARIHNKDIYNSLKTLNFKYRKVGFILGKYFKATHSQLIQNIMDNSVPRVWYENSFIDTFDEFCSENFENTVLGNTIPYNIASILKYLFPLQTLHQNSLIKNPIFWWNYDWIIVVLLCFKKSNFYFVEDILKIILREMLMMV